VEGAPYRHSPLADLPQVKVLRVGSSGPEPERGMMDASGDLETMDYLLLKGVHMSAVTLSFAGFFARGVGSLGGAAWVRGRAARTFPHVVDTVLLVSAIALAWTLRLSPLAAPWLMAKIIGLVVYVVLGTVALKPGRPPGVRAAAWVGAMLVFGWIVSVAITKSPAGVFSLLH
jgi:uncharacterized membrane protein SirB2